MVRVREPSYDNICLSLLHAEFFFSKKNHVFDEWDAIYILFMNKIIIFVFNLLLFRDQCAVLIVKEQAFVQSGWENLLLPSTKATTQMVELQGFF